MCFESRNCTSYDKLIIQSAHDDTFISRLLTSFCIQCISLTSYGTLVYKSRYLSANSLAMLMASVWPSTIQLVPDLLERLRLTSDQKSRVGLLLLRSESASRSLIILSSSRLTLRIA